MDVSEQFKTSFSLPPEQQAIRDKCFHPSGEFVEFPIEDVETSIPARFEKIARMYPDRNALTFKDRTFSYKELNEAANRVAWAVAKICGDKNEPVAVLLEQGAMAVVAIFGVLKAGGIYAPLDTDFPSRRLNTLLEDSTAAVILTNSRNLPLAETLAANRATLLNIDDLGLSTENLELPLRPTTLAAIIYTSGSSGQPKGIIQDHRNLLHLVMRSTNFYRLSPHDRIALLRSFSVSGGTLHMLNALLNGAELLPFDLKQEGLTNLAKWLIEAQITTCSLTPRTLRHLTEALNENESLSKLRRITLSGEPLYNTEMEACRKYFSPDCVFVNSLGATEIPFAAQYVIDNQVLPERSLVPVGFPATDIEIRLVQENGIDVKAGEIGEIIVRSRYLASGYWRSPELTRQKFLPDPMGGDERSYLTGDVGRFLPDGALLHLGRKDHLVKIRGYRVSILEIETTLLENQRLKEVAVTVWDREAGDRYLAAYLVAAAKQAPTMTELLTFLRARLPDYMIPTTFLFLKSLPQTNGKVDRQALPCPDGIRPNLDQAYTAPTSAIETNLVRAWEEVLGVHPVGIHDDFLDLGGNSLTASRLISRLVKTLRLELPIKALFESPTVAEMAKIVEQHQAKSARKGELERLLTEVGAMSEEDADKFLAMEKCTNRSRRQA